LLPQVVLEHTQPPFEHVDAPVHAVWFCQVPFATQSWGTPAEHCFWLGEQSLHPPADATQASGHVCDAGMAQLPLPQVPVAW
jgi:hypothetical protein